MFQSSPAINCGRHNRVLKFYSCSQCFNPHPRSTAGVTWITESGNGVMLVSILTRDQLRASPTCRASASQQSTGFNPHPRSTAGVTNWAESWAEAFDVSILTRDQLRASHTARRRIVDMERVSILTRDQLRASRLKRKRLKQKGFYPILREPPKRWFVFHTFFHTPKISPTNSITYTCANL